MPFGEEQSAPFDFDAAKYEEIGIGVFTQLDGKGVFRILRPVKTTEAGQIIPLNCERLCFSSSPGDIAVYHRAPQPAPQKTREEYLRDAEALCKKRHDQTALIQACTMNSLPFNFDDKYCRFGFLKIRSAGGWKKPNNIQSMSAAFGFDVNAWLDNLPEDAATNLQNTPSQTDSP